ncbi:MAG: large conductance mechanosensitive channel protein MscL [Tepidiformaceae bacterium]
MLREFKQFLLRGNVVDLAIAVVIGLYFGNVINALVKDVITPLIGAIGGTGNFAALNFKINGSPILYGDVINEIITFIIVAAVVFFAIVKPMNYLIARSRKEPPADPTTKKCPECFSEIPVQATRCAFCTVPLTV